MGDYFFFIISSSRVTFVRRWWECNDVEWPCLFEKRCTELKSLGSNSGSVFVSFFGKDPILFRTFQWDSGEEATENLTGFWGGTQVDQYHWRWIDKPLQWYGSVVCGFNLQCNCSNALSNACSSQIFNHFKFVLFQQWPRLEQWFDFSQVSEKLERGPKYFFKKPS